MSNDPILNSAMKKHPRGQVRVYDETGKRIAGTSCGGYLREYEDARKPRTVTTAAELDALPEGSIVRDRSGLALQRSILGWNCINGVREIRREELERDAFPATVIHETTR